MNIIKILLLSLLLVSCSHANKKNNTTRNIANSTNYDNLHFGSCLIDHTNARLIPNLRIPNTPMVFLGHKPSIISKKWIGAELGQTLSPSISQENYEIPNSNYRISFLYSNYQLFISIKHINNTKLHESNHESYFWSKLIKDGDSFSRSVKSLKARSITHEFNMPNSSNIKVVCDLNTDYFKI